MIIDIKTLALCNLSIALCFCIAFSVYLTNQKTYSGFSLWTFALYLYVSGYLFLVLRGVIPTGISVIGVNGLLALSTVCRLDAITRFLHNKPLNKFWYCLPVIVIASCSYFYFRDDNIWVRNYILSSTLFVLILAIGWQLIRYAPSNHRSLYFLGASIVCFRGISLMIRAFHWMYSPGEPLFATDNHHAIFFLVEVITEIGINVLFLMMHNQRTETSLVDSNMALVDSERRYRSLSDAAFEGIIISVKGKVLEVNDLACAMFGYSSDEIIGKQTIDFIAAEHRGTVRSKIISSDEQTYEVKGQRKDLSTFPLEVRAKMFPYKGFKARVTAVRDLTEKKKTEAEISLLRNILPLCSYCKKVRDDKGYWEQVDVYIDKHLQTDISHSICPNCIKKYYPELHQVKGSDQ